ncbi:MAG: hypothetical protein Q8P30_03060 [Candidatus Uhrbacteria bacterium]|nr:hypothetical protein [Candidatus Uhrbacteria bacterium]
MKRFTVPIILVTLLFSFNSIVDAAMTSTNYEIRFDSFTSGGDDLSSSATYQLRDSAGNLAIDGSTSATYDIRPGYREGIYDRVATFEIFLKNRTSQVAATSLIGTTIGVTSTAGISTGDMVLVVENEGSTQNSAIGRVASIGASSVTVDSLVNSGSAPVINGVGDYLYIMNGSGLAIGSISSAEISTSAIAWEVDADVDDGYSVYIYEDHDLNLGGGSTGTSISDVSDGSVTIGDSEYGARSSDQSLASSTFDTSDTAITTTQAQVASRSGSSFDSRDFLTFKVSRASGDTGGSYSHTVYLIYVGDY